jgi:hypothetical protein
LNAGDFVPPVNGRGRKLLFDPDSVETWIKSRQSSPVSVPPVTTPAKKQRQEEKAYQERQEAARVALERHHKPKRQQNETTRKTEPACVSNPTQRARKGTIMSTIILTLFLSQALLVGGLRNTAFSVTPTEITEANASEVFRYDHTPILFKEGHSLGENFEHAVAIPFDIDNSHSDNPADWVTPDDIARKLKELGINYLIVASRNHLLPKEGKSPRPKFHVYMRLSMELTQKTKMAIPRFILPHVTRMSRLPNFSFPKEQMLTQKTRAAEHHLTWRRMMGTSRSSTSSFPKEPMSKMSLCS